MENDKYDKIFTAEEIAEMFQSKKAEKLNTGARGLRTILENLMLDMQYEVPDRSSKINSLTVTKGSVEGTEKPIQEIKPEKDDSAAE